MFSARNLSWIGGNHASSLGYGLRRKISSGPLFHRYFVEKLGGVPHFCGLKEFHRGQARTHYRIKVLQKPLMAVIDTVSQHQSRQLSTVSTAPGHTTNNVDESLLSPMMQHYVATKRDLSKSLGGSSGRSVMLMYRVGDFFESFFEDAVLLSEVCEIALTSKDAGKALGSRVPMAGVPHYCIDEKIKALLAQDITVAVVDQVQSAAETPAGKLVKRAITRLITPGTVNEENLLDSKTSSYIASLVVKPNRKRKQGVSMSNNVEFFSDFSFGFSYADVSTGEFKTTDGSGLDAVRRLLVSVAPSELLFVEHSIHKDLCSQILEEVKHAGIGVVTKREPLSDKLAESTLINFHNIDNVESISCRGRPSCSEAAAVLISFIKQMLITHDAYESPISLNPLTVFSTSELMFLDAACLQNLEVIETLRDGIRERSLQWAVDRTVTNMGARCLRSWLLAPSMNLSTITQRHELVEAFANDRNNTRANVQSALKNFADIERLSGRIGSGRVSPRELRWLCESIVRLPPILANVNACLSKQCCEEEHLEILTELLSPVDIELVHLAEEVIDALTDPAPSSLISEFSIHGGEFSKENWNISSKQILRTGYSKKLDSLRLAIDEPDEWIGVLEKKEKLRSKIDSLCIKHIKNTGFVLRIPRSVGEKKMDTDPMYFARLGYDRVQSTKAELRFRFGDLKTQETEYNAAYAEALLLEVRLFDELRKRVRHFVPYMRDLGKQIATIDVLAGFAQVAEEQNYVKPEVLPTSERTLDLVDARHPVVEQTLPIGSTFVPNCFRLGACDNDAFPDMSIICGPNAAGKSCALRSVGLICILVQIGSFVPASYARVSLCDRIFTRVGAVDDLARGQSTFQVEMAETACILSHATSSSLVLLDEVGRGTSNVDGIAIAWSVSEYLASRNLSGIEPPRSMFVTHYHELNHLPSFHKNVKSFHLHMEKKGGGKSDAISNQAGWVTSHKIVPGPSFESLGLAIAGRAGFPDAVVERAQQIAKFLKEPARALGASLRSALAENEQWGCDEQEERICPETAVSEEVETMEESSYEVGFREGYNKAIEEVRVDMENRLRGSREHRPSDS